MSTESAVPKHDLTRIAEALEMISTWLGLLVKNNSTPPGAVPAPAVAATVKAAATPKAPKPAAAKAAPPPAAKAEVETGPGVDDVRAALRAYQAIEGVDAAKALLVEFGASKVSEVKPEDFAGFIQRCSE